MNEIQKIITEYHLLMNQQHKQIFHEKAQERFIKLFFLHPDSIPEFFHLQNRQKSFFYKHIMYKYENACKEINGRCWLKIFQFNQKNILELDKVKYVYQEVLDFYNTVIVNVINILEPQIKNYKFKTLPNHFKT